MKSTVLFILLDAFNCDYISESNTPFIWDLCQSNIYVKKIRPSFGFCERSEIFTGCYPDETNNFTAIGFNQDQSPFVILKKIPFPKTPSKSFVFDNRYSRKIISNLYRILGIRFPVFQIPFGLLPHLTLTEDLTDHTKTGAFSVQSIFDMLDKYNKTFCYDSFTALGLANGNDNNRIDTAIKNARLNKDFYALFVGEIDYISHVYGTTSKETANGLRAIDKKVQYAISSFREKFNDFKVVIVGDHGMIDIDLYFNLWDSLEPLLLKNNLVSGKDYLMFLDSTIARFSCCHEIVREKITNILCNKPFTDCGSLISLSLAKKYHLPVPGKLYGDVLWWANPGTVIFPDFFHRQKKPKAMHGYSPDLNGSKGFCVLAGDDIEKKIIEEGELIDVCPTLCDFLNINTPKDSVGKSFINEY